MPIIGYLYVFVNSSMPGLVKIGRTERSPADRAAELSTFTAVPTPFVHVFDEQFEDSEAAEAAVHALLEQRGVRTSPSREFFTISAKEAIDIIQLVHRGSQPVLQAQPHNRDAGHPTQMREPWRDLVEQADDLLFGRDDAIADPTRAHALLETAARLGAGPAYYRLGEAYYRGWGCRQSHQKALDVLLSGARMGYSRCYGLMISVYHHLITVAKVDGRTPDPTWKENVRKCYAKYFADLVVEDFEQEDEAADHATLYVMGVAEGELALTHYDSFESIREVVLLNCADLADQYRDRAGDLDRNPERFGDRLRVASNVEDIIRQSFGELESLAASPESVAWRIGYFEWKLERAQLRSDVHGVSSTQKLLAAFERLRIPPIERVFAATGRSHEVSGLRHRVEHLSSVARTLRGRIGGESADDFIARVRAKRAERQALFDDIDLKYGNLETPMLQEQRQQKGLCYVCGGRLSFLDKLRGSSLCRDHR